MADYDQKLFAELLQMLRQERYEVLRDYLRARREDVLADLATLDNPNMLYKAQGRLFEIQDLLELFSTDRGDTGHTR